MVAAALAERSRASERAIVVGDGGALLFECHCERSHVLAEVTNDARGLLVRHKKGVLAVRQRDLELSMGGKSN